MSSEGQITQEASPLESAVGKPSDTEEQSSEGTSLPVLLAVSLDMLNIRFSFRLITHSFYTILILPVYAVMSDSFRNCSEYNYNIIRYPLIGLDTKRSSKLRTSDSKQKHGKGKKKGMQRKISLDPHCKVKLSKLERALSYLGECLQVNCYYTILIVISPISAVDCNAVSVSRLMLIN